MAKSGTNLVDEKRSNIRSFTPLDNDLPPINYDLYPIQEEEGQSEDQLQDLKSAQTETKTTISVPASAPLPIINPQAAEPSFWQRAGRALQSAWKNHKYKMIGVGLLLTVVTTAVTLGLAGVVTIPIFFATMGFGLASTTGGNIAIGAGVITAGSLGLPYIVKGGIAYWTYEDKDGYLNDEVRSFRSSRASVTERLMQENDDSPRENTFEKQDSFLVDSDDEDEEKEKYNNYQLLDPTEEPHPSLVSKQPTVIVRVR